jgi:hypothetical protein
MATNATWPFVTLPDFEVVTSKSFNTTAGAELFMFAPRVPRQERRAFEAYAQAHQGWIKQDLENRGSDIDPGPIPERIYTVSKDDDVETEFSAPLWQIGPAPTNASIILKDIYSQASFRRMIDDVLIQKQLLVRMFFLTQSMFSAALLVSFDHIVPHRYFVSFHVCRRQLSEVVDQEALNEQTASTNYLRNQGQPSSYAAVPVFDSFDDKTKKIVGFLFAVVPWDIYFQNILADAAEVVSVEIEDTCGSLFTYDVHGPEAIYGGEGKVKKSPEFERMKESADFAEFGRFTGTPDLEYLQFCNYRLSVYPTVAFKKEFTSDDPKWFAGAVFTIFVFTSMVFLFFDFAVSRRQRKVMASATRTRAIVAQMFPGAIQQRIFEEADRSSGSGFLANLGQKHKLKAFLNGDHESEGEESQPIAELFPEVTLVSGSVGQGRNCQRHG